MGNKLKRIEVEAFRVFKEKQVFDFAYKDDVVADLVVIYGPNGFGKTSVVDAVEWGLTGKIQRISKNKIVDNKIKNEQGYILKNRNSDLSNGQVVFVADNNDKLTRKTKRLSERAKHDYYVGTKINKGNTFSNISKDDIYNKNILACDQIDAFLKAVTPEERYKGLIGFWDDSNETEIYSKILSVFDITKKRIREEENKIAEIEKKIGLAKVNVYPIQEINKDIHRLTKVIDGDKLNLINEDFTQKNLMTTKEKVVLIKSKLKNRVDVLNRYFIDVEYIKEEYEDYIKRRKLFDEKNLEKNNIIKILSLFKLYKEKKTQLKENLDKHESFMLTRKSIEYLIANLKTYEDIKNAIDNKTKKIKLSNSDLSTIKLHLRKIEDEILSDRKKKDSVEKKKREFLYKISNYNNFRENIRNFNSIYTKINKLYNKKEKIEINIRNINNVIDKKKYMLNNIDSIEYNGSSYSNLYEEIKTSIEISQKTEYILTDKRKQYNNLGNLEQGKQELIKLGRFYVESTQNNKCPLCNKKYKDYSELLSIINASLPDNTFMDKLRNEIEELNSILDKSNKDIDIKRKRLIGHIQNDINILNRRIITISGQKDELCKTIIENENKKEKIRRETEEISIYYNEVEKLSITNNRIKEYPLLWEKEIIEIDDQFIKLKESLEKNDVLKNECEEKISNLNKLLFSLGVALKQLENNETFIEFKKIQKEINISSEEKIPKENIFIRDQLEELNLTINRLNSEIEEILTVISNEDEEILKKQLNIMNENISKLEELNIKFEYAVKNTLKIETDKLDYEFAEDIMRTKDKELESLDNAISLSTKIVECLELLNNNIKLSELEKEKKDEALLIKKLKNKFEKLEEIKNSSTEYIISKINTAFNTDVINSIYDMIEPHPELKKIEFVPDFSEDDKPKINIYSLSEKGEMAEPSLFLSAAQLNILSLSIFFARILQEEIEGLSTIFMDDTIEHLDNINILSFIDLIRTIISELDIQIILTTHNEDFYNLLKRKIDPEYYKARYLKFDGYGELETVKVKSNL